jgi:hypothetical protein
VIDPGGWLTPSPRLVGWDKADSDPAVEKYACCTHSQNKTLCRDSSDGHAQPFSDQGQYTAHLTSQSPGRVCGSCGVLGPTLQPLFSDPSTPYCMCCLYCLYCLYFLDCLYRCRLRLYREMARPKQGMRRTQQVHKQGWLFQGLVLSLTFP